MSDFFEPYTDDDEPDKIGVSHGNTYWQHKRPPVIPARPVQAVRDKLQADMEAIVYSTQSGAWLFRHPPGAGKTFRWQETARDYMGPVVGCAPTVAEAEKMSEATGIPMLRRQDTSNCKQHLLEESQAPSHRRLAKHIDSGHSASSFCRDCPFVQECRATPGAYRYEQAQFARDCAKGTVRAITTVKMLEYVSHSMLKSPNRIVVWTDEDLMPHLQSEDGAFSRAEILEWAKHASGCGMMDKAVTIVTEVERLLSSVAPRSSECMDTIDDHTTSDGREWSIPADDLAAIRSMLNEYEEECGTIPQAHPSEFTGEDRETLPVGAWRPAMFRRLAALLRGAVWCHVDKSDQRSLRGVSLNRHLLDLGKVHAVLQSDATASPAIWSSLWKDSWRGSLEDAPERAAFVRWWPACIKSSNDKAKTEAGMRAITARKSYGKCGILTFKAWEDYLCKFLRSKRYTVACLSDGDDRTDVDFVIGHFGKHDRGVNDYHVAALSCFYVMGSFRVPMHTWHRQAGAVAEMGGTTPAVRHKADTICFPVGVDGIYPDMNAHRGMNCADQRTRWIADYERGAQLSQAIERIRSVDRKEKGMFPIPVFLWGAEACQLTFPISIEYEAPQC